MGDWGLFYDADAALYSRQGSRFVRDLYASAHFYGKNRDGAGAVVGGWGDLYRVSVKKAWAPRIKIDSC